MQYQFSSAGERALVFAAGCTSRAGCAELAAAALLLGILAESECQGALMLAEHGITPQAVRRQWSRLADPLSNGGDQTTPLSILTPELNRAIQIVSQLVAEYINPPILATEHLLLSLLVADNELSHWLLSQQGVRLEDVEAQIRRRHGYKEGPLPMETESEAETVEHMDVEELQIGNCKLQNENCGTDQDKLHTSSFHPPQSTVQPIAYSLQSTASLRIIDAAVNRAREGLRVVEDFVRFVLDDQHLTEQCKQLRHDLAALLDQIPGEQLLAARETQADVGTSLATASEEHRSDSHKVLVANFGRLQESLRSLEEFGKLIDPAWAAEIKQLRYRSYTLHRAVAITRDSIKRLANARLYVLIDGRPTLDEFRQMVQSLVTSGVHVLQLRDKDLDDRQLVERARLLRELTRGTSTLCVINDRPDVAALCHADGVHLGQEDMTVKDARAIIGADMLLGVSAHTIAQARQAVLDGANYIGVGPTFPSGTKQFEKFPGLEFLRAVAAEIRLPAFAIGGITPQNLPDVLAAGITRVAVGGAVVAAADPSSVVRALVNKIEGKGPGR